MLGAVLGGDEHGERLDRVAGVSAQRARLALRALGKLDRAARRRAVAALTQTAVAGGVLPPLPEESPGLDGSALERALANVAPTLRRRVTDLLVAAFAPHRDEGAAALGATYGWQPTRIVRALRYLGLMMLAEHAHASDDPATTDALRLRLGPAWSPRLDATMRAAAPLGFDASPMRMPASSVSSAAGDVAALLSALGAGLAARLPAAQLAALARRLPAPVAERALDARHQPQTERPLDMLAPNVFVAALERADALADALDPSRAPAVTIREADPQ